MTTLDRDGFSWLLLHANALPMLAMQQVMAEIRDDLAHAEPPADDGLTEAQREEQSRIALNELADRIEADPELAALTVFNFAAPVMSDEEIDRLEQQSRDEDAAANEAMASLDELPDGPLDLDAFLLRAYAKPLPAPRVEAAFGRADVAALVAALAQLPADLPPLTAPMDGHGLARWLAFFRTEDPQCEALVFEVSRLDEDA
ncbi:hypothetical protein [Rhodanobacter ginsengiterrae]|uniref:hypothetical protein n=1 Tax=Rhodanobacter ginsengiterrae TaxID=2008451 RepID=UPI003CF548A1